jgi:hypothetical protein
MRCGYRVRYGAEPQWSGRPGDSGEISGRAPLVAAVQAANLRNGNNAARSRPLHRPQPRCILRQGQVGPQERLDVTVRDASLNTIT